MNQEKKSRIAPVVKSILKKYRLKGTLSVRNHMTLCLTITQGPIDFITDFNKTAEPRQPVQDSIDVNPYWFHDHFTGKAKQALKELFAALNEGNHDNSDIQTDYFDVGWYVDVNIGKWNKPYALVK